MSTHRTRSLVAKLEHLTHNFMIDRISRMSDSEVRAQLGESFAVLGDPMGGHAVWTAFTTAQRESARREYLAWVAAQLVTCRPGVQ